MKLFNTHYSSRPRAFGYFKRMMLRMKLKRFVENTQGVDVPSRLREFYQLTKAFNDVLYSQTDHSELSSRIYHYELGYQCECGLVSVIDTLTEAIHLADSLIKFEIVDTTQFHKSDIYTDGLNKFFLKNEKFSYLQCQRLAVDFFNQAAELSKNKNQYKTPSTTKAYSIYMQRTAVLMNIFLISYCLLCDFPINKIMQEGGL